MNMLFVAASTPTPVTQRTTMFLKALVARGHTVTLVCGTTEDSAALHELRAICQRVVAVKVPAARRLRNIGRALPGDLPLRAAPGFGPPLIQAVQEELRRGSPAGEPYDVAHVEQLSAAGLGYALQSVPTVFDAAYCQSLRDEQVLRACRGTAAASLRAHTDALLDLKRTRRYEAALTGQYDQILVAAPEDAWALQTLADNGQRSIDAGMEASDDERAATVRRLAALARIHIVPSAVDTMYLAPQAIPRDAATIIFHGALHSYAGTAAAIFLARDIMPMVWAQREDARLIVLGRAPSRDVQALTRDPRVTVPGFVHDLRPVLARATLAAVPLHLSAGAPSGVLETMAMACPLISSAGVGAALQAQAGRDLLLAQGARGYAQAILALLDDPARAARIGQAGRQYVEQQHHLDGIAQQLEQIYDRIVERPLILATLRDVLELGRVNV